MLLFQYLQILLLFICDIYTLYNNVINIWKYKLHLFINTLTTEIFLNEDEKRNSQDEILFHHNVLCLFLNIFKIKQFYMFNFSFLCYFSNQVTVLIKLRKGKNISLSLTKLNKTPTGNKVKSILKIPVFDGRPHLSCLIRDDCTWGLYQYC